MVDSWPEKKQYPVKHFLKSWLGSLKNAATSSSTLRFSAKQQCTLLVVDLCQVSSAARSSRRALQSFAITSPRPARGSRLPLEVSPTSVIALLIFGLLLRGVLSQRSQKNQITREFIRRKRMRKGVQKTHKLLDQTERSCQVDSLDMFLFLTCHLLENSCNYCVGSSCSEEHDVDNCSKQPECTGGGGCALADTVLRASFSCLLCDCREGELNGYCGDNVPDMLCWWYYKALCDVLASD